MGHRERSCLGTRPPVLILGRTLEAPGGLQDPAVPAPSPEVLLYLIGVQPALGVFKSSAGDSGVQQRVRTSDLDGAGQCCLLALLSLALPRPSTTSALKGDNEEPSCKVGGIGGGFKPPVRACICYLTTSPGGGCPQAQFTEEEPESRPYW